MRGLCCTGPDPRQIPDCFAKGKFEYLEAIFVFRWKYFRLEIPLVSQQEDEVTVIIDKQAEIIVITFLEVSVDCSRSGLKCIP